MRPPRQLLVLASALVALVVLVVIVAARGESSPGHDTPEAGSAVTVGAGGGAAEGTDVTVRPATTVRPASTTTAPAGPATSTTAAAGRPTATSTRPTVPATAPATVPATVPATTDPFAPTPSTQLPPEPDELPGPPTDDCVDAAASPAIVEIVFDLDGARYAGVEAPPCLRVRGAQRLSVRNDSRRATTVSVGTQAEAVAPGAALLTEPMGSELQIGDVVDLYIESLDLTILVQVLG